MTVKGTCYDCKYCGIQKHNIRVCNRLRLYIKKKTFEITVEETDYCSMFEQKERK